MAPATASKAVSKKRKLEITADASSAVAEGPLQEAPKGQLQGHSQCVSGVVWPDQDSIYSGSWDHSVSLLMLHHLLRDIPQLVSQYVNSWGRTTLPMAQTCTSSSPHSMHSTALSISFRESVIQVAYAY